MGEESVLFANAAFYAALADGDVALMNQLWSRTASVSCIHPGWPLLIGQDDVRDSWARILAEPPEIECRAPRVLFHGTTALVLCIEVVAGAYLAASNLFIREEDGWRLVHHQAGPTPDQPDSTPVETGSMH